MSDQERLASGLPCEDCGSSDARSEFITEEGDHLSHCYSCQMTRSAVSGSKITRAPVKGMPLIEDLEFRGYESRGLSEKTCRRFGYGFSPSEGAQVAPYTDSRGRVVAQKVRKPGKQFVITGDMSSAGLFGQSLCRGSGKRIVITEGEIDALSMAEAIGDWPVVSLPNGAGGARRSIQKNLEFLLGFEQVVLAFDQDDAGIKAVEGCLDLFRPGQLLTMQYDGCKDANELLVERGASAVRDAFWKAQPFRPDKIVNLRDLKAQIRERPKMGHAYPWSGLTDKTCGFHPGDLVTWTSGTGVGKSSLMAEVAYHAAMNLGLRVGIIALEEGAKRTARRYVGIHMNKPLHVPTCEYDQDEFDVAFDATLGTGRFLAYDHFGSDDIDRIVTNARFLYQAEEVDLVILDHVSMVVSGAELSSDERRLLDHIMTNLKTLAVEVNKPIHVVSHLRRGDGKAHEEGAQVSLNHLRGTQAIAQLSDTVIAAERNQQAETEAERNQTLVRVLKNRLTGQNGPACKLQYDAATGRLSQIDWSETRDAANF